MTALKEAFEKEGLRPRDVALDRAIAVYLNSGGTIEEARRRVDLAAERMPGMDHTADACEGHRASVQTRQPVEDARGHSAAASDGQENLASPSSSPPARDPIPQRAPINFGAAALAIKTKLAESIMDRIKIDGEAIGDYSPRRAQLEGARKTREGYILREVARIALNIANPPPGAKIRDLVKASEMECIEQAAKALNDVA